MFDFGKRIIEMMEKCFPLLIRRRPPKFEGMTLGRVPPNKQYVAIGTFETPAKFVPLIPAGGGNNAFGCCKRSFERRALSLSNIQNRYFQDQACLLAPIHAATQARSFP